MSRMESLEVFQASNPSSIFFVNRASFTLDNVYYTSEFDSAASYGEFVTSVWNSQTLTTLTNLFIQMKGGIYRNLMVRKLTSIYS